ncbi:MAG: protein phosphatase 2C domain-containing protein [Candidatus Micrarchaeia archaeon]
MEKVIRGSTIAEEDEAGGKSSFCEFHCMVRKGHEECGDSAFVYCDDGKAILAVFDGVSGAPGASLASSEAADSILGSLRKHQKITDEKMKGAVISAMESISAGYTTAAILFLHKDGSFTICSVGDSPVYSIDHEGKTSLELPLARTVGNDSSILKFFYYRNIVTSVLGRAVEEVSINLRSGKLGKGQMLILATDGLSDNLFMKVHDGYVIESSGSEDLSGLVGKKRSPKATVRSLFDEVLRRIGGGRVDHPDRILVPKEDDISIIAVRLLP